MNDIEELRDFEWVRVSDLAEGDLLVLTPGHRVSNEVRLYITQRMHEMVDKLGVKVYVLVLDYGDTLDVLRRVKPDD